MLPDPVQMRPGKRSDFAPARVEPSALDAERPYCRVNGGSALFKLYLADLFYDEHVPVRGAVRVGIALFFLHESCSSLGRGGVGLQLLPVWLLSRLDCIRWTLVPPVARSRTVPSCQLP